MSTDFKKRLQSAKSDFQRAQKQAEIMKGDSHIPSGQYTVKVRAKIKEKNELLRVNFLCTIIDTDYAGLPLYTQNFLEHNNEGYLNDQLIELQERLSTVGYSLDADALEELEDLLEQLSTECPEVLVILEYENDYPRVTFIEKAEPETETEPEPSPEPETEPEEQEEKPKPKRKRKSKKAKPEPEPEPEEEEEEEEEDDPAEQYRAGLIDFCEAIGADFDPDGTIDALVQAITPEGEGNYWEWEECTAEEQDLLSGLHKAGKLDVYEITDKPKPVAKKKAAKRK